MPIGGWRKPSNRLGLPSGQSGSHSGGDGPQRRAKKWVFLSQTDLISARRLRQEQVFSRCSQKPV